MKIPNKIKIGGHDISISVDNHLSRVRDHVGEANIPESTIVLDANSSQSQQDSTLLHEIIEHINYNYELKLEHSQICVLEATLYQILRDNKLNFGG